MIVTLCGSMRFADDFARLEAELTLAGHLVLAPTVFPPGTSLEDDQIALLDRLHRQKIDLGDEVLIVNVGGYVGDSTRGEIEYARSRGIPVRSLEPLD